MSGVRTYGQDAAIAAQTHRLLATAASLDYVLLLVTDSAGTRIPPDDAERAIHDGLSRAVDDAIVLLRAVLPLNDDDARIFVRDGMRAVRSAMDAEALADDDRTFALIALVNDLAS